MRVRGSLFCALILSVLSRSMGHSWIDCTSYNGQVVDNSLDSQLCEGRPRDFTAFNGGGFGRDRGFDYQPQKGQPACITGYSANSYDSDWPMATYNPGESIKLLWPAKNHDKGPCTNPYIPDTSLKLFMDCGLEGERNPTIDDFAVDSKLVIDFKANGGKGFQNCPAFCENPDKAVCFGDFVVPNDAPSGRVCTFMWYWIFNANTDPYTTCWEACIGGNCGGAQSPGSTAAPPQPTQPQPTQPQPTQPQPTQPQPTSFPECANLPPLRTLKPSPNMPQPTNAPPATSGACSAMYAQCGGQNWSGPTCCQPGTICQVIVRNFTLYAAVHYFNSS